MEVLNKNQTLLSNCEVFGLLQQTKEALAYKVLTKKKNQKIDVNNSTIQTLTDQQRINVDKHLPTVVYESLRFLEKSPCAHQTPQIVNAFLTKLNTIQQEFQLTKIEKLGLVNHRPASAVELQVLIEDSEERFSLEQMDKLLEFVLDNLPAGNVTEIVGESNQIDLE